jgi:hypothetical protein
MERGIDICGDASMIMSQILERNGIESKIVTFPGHVVVAATIQLTLIRPPRHFFEYCTNAESDHQLGE